MGVSVVCINFLEDSCRGCNVEIYDAQLLRKLRKKVHIVLQLIKDVLTQFGFNSPITLRLLVFVLKQLIGVIVAILH